MASRIASTVSAPCWSSIDAQPSWLRGSPAVGDSAIFAAPHECCSSMRTIRPSSRLTHVRYEIRGDLARRANEMERLGYDIVPLNIGNPGVFGLRTPESIRLAIVENLDRKSTRLNSSHEWISR